ncbi:hypothetical protein [Methylosarcina fibrata]|uniref:hypothetical protein n=1 Tax=Methylosarcina fibrata TaxID=105972 RepID=UPI0003609FE3|nr:hypothetical protein [Methylosarcina fibrata]
MNLSRLSDRSGFYHPVCKPRLRKESAAVVGAEKAGALQDHPCVPAIAKDLSHSAPGRQPVSPLPGVLRYRPYEYGATADADRLIRDPGISRYNLDAVSAYQRTENQEERDRIEQMLGFDLYV